MMWKRINRKTKKGLQESIEVKTCKDHPQTGKFCIYCGCKNVGEWNFNSDKWEIYHKNHFGPDHPCNPQVDFPNSSIAIFPEYCSVCGGDHECHCYTPPFQSQESIVEKTWGQRYPGWLLIIQMFIGLLVGSGFGYVLWVNQGGKIEDFLSVFLMLLAVFGVVTAAGAVCWKKLDGGIHR